MRPSAWQQSRKTRNSRTESRWADHHEDLTLVCQANGQKDFANLHPQNRIPSTRTCPSSSVKQRPAPPAAYFLQQVSVASLLYSMGDQYKDVAASVVMGILEADEADAGALFQYASIAQDRGLTQDATRVFLRLLVLNQDDSKVK